MITFVVGRRYVFHNEIGVHVGTFVGADHRVRHGLIFKDVVRIVEVDEQPQVTINASKVIDAESWHQTVKLIGDVEASNPGIIRTVLKMLNDRESVTVYRANARKVLGAK